jgi:hypothetical protein
MSAMEQTSLGNFKMVSWRRSNVDHGRPNFVQKQAQIGEMPPHAEALAQLFSHQFLAIANTRNFASLYSLDLRRVRVSDLPTSDYGNFKHVERCLYS